MRFSKGVLAAIAAALVAAFVVAAMVYRKEKQQQALPLSGEEISTFEQSREALFQNPVARGFLDAQEELHQMREGIHKYVNKTLELGRLPAEEDFESCGHGCNCGH